jgi:hypothetical protein
MHNAETLEAETQGAEPNLERGTRNLDRTKNSKPRTENRRTPNVNQEHVPGTRNLERGT